MHLCIIEFKYSRIHAFPHFSTLITQNPPFIHSFFYIVFKRVKFGLTIQKTETGNKKNNENKSHFFNHRIMDDHIHQ